MLSLIIWSIIIILIVNIFNRLTCGMCRSSSCLVGKTAIVTGGNSGIGFQVCLNLASRGCTVIIADKDDSSKSRMEIIKRTNNPNIHSKLINLASFKSIREFASDIATEIDKLDILINNAGIPNNSETITEDDLDLTMQVNYFGPFLLTHLLINLLKKSDNGRIVFTSSILAWLAYFPAESFGQLGQIVGWFAYCHSKLATIIASDIFAEKLKDTRIISNSINPGHVNTRIFSKLETNFIFSQITYIFFKLSIAVFYGKDAYEGSQTTIYAAISQKSAHVSGKFFYDCRAQPNLKPFPARNKDFCKTLWQISEERVHLAQEEKL